MKAFRIAICCAILMHAVAPECLDGCLKCDSKDDCQFCDGTNKYILDLITCKSIKMSNCVTISTTGNCLVCESGYFVDQATLKCTAITDASKVENCTTYASAKVCSICAKGFYVKESACVAVETPLANCLTSNSANLTQCLECEKGYLLSLDKKSCVQVTTIENCASYSTLMCKSCTSDYIKDNNIYIEQIYQFTDEAAKFKVLKSLINDTNGFLDQGVYNVCKAKAVDNCGVFTQYNKCKTCNTGYILNSDLTCDAYPDEQITNCSKYSSATVCVKCVDGMHLENNSCTANVAIANCKTYSSAATTTTCIECASDYYLTSNTCVLRTATVDNCSTLSGTVDKCDTCKTGLTITSDGLACMATISNCMTFKESNETTEKHICLQCMTKYYYKDSDQACVLGTVSNCNTYQTNANKCTECVNKYYLNADLACVQHATLDGCVTYSPAVSKTCTVCDTKSMLFTQSNVCVIKEADITNCIEYATSTTCKTCKDGFEVSGAGRCNEIISPSSCLVKKNNKCLKCLTEYYINETGSCDLIENFFKLQCAAHNVDGTKSYLDYDCLYCNPGTFPLYFKDSHVCISSTSISPVVQGCLKYYTVTTNGVKSYLCALCESGKVVSSSNTCIASCNPSEARIVMEGKNYNSKGASTYDSYTIMYNNKCINARSISQDNCSYLYPDLFDHSVSNGDFTYRCATCNSGYEKVIVKKASIITNDPVNNQYGSTPVDSFPGFTCVLSSSITTGTSGSTTPNCEYYYLISTDTYGCYKCKFGYTGVVVSGGYISVCVEFSTCDTTATVSSGLNTTKSSVGTLNTVWTSMFSCFKCKSSVQIPFVALNYTDTTSIPKLEPFSVNVSSAALNTGTGGNAVACYTLANTSFGISLVSNFVFPTNCALGVIDTTKAANAIDSTSATPTAANATIFCVACKAGYKPLYVANSVGLLMVYSCVQINTAKCASSTWFNNCSDCAARHVYSYNPTTKYVSFDTCEAFTDVNCYAVNTTNVSNFECVFCKKGFTLNIDKICEKINSSKCAADQFNQEFGYHAAFDTDQHAIGMILAPFGSGCHKCESGFLALRQNEVDYFCTTSSYVAGNTYAINTKLLDKCSNYYVSDFGDLLCKVCSSGYILTTAFKCVLATNYPNCDIARDSTGCNVCKTGYANIGTACQQKTIEKCLVYNEGSTISTMICLECEPEYYPSGSTCAKGSVSYCKNLISQFECKTCNNLHTLVTARDGKSYCYPIEPKLNCLSVTSKLSDGKVECAQCAANYALSTATSNKNETICYQFQQIPNCLTYDYTSEIATSTFNGLQCIDGYYADTAFTCKLRAVTHKKCVEYEPKLDKCKTCSDGYYVAASGLCEEYPTGIKGCRIYEDKSTCTACINGAYLETNECTFLDTAKLIANCIYYKTEKICNYCKTGFAVSNGACVAAQAQNCLTYDRATKCSSCSEGYGFKDDNGIRSCVEKQVSRCVTSEDYSPFTCLICSTGFYPNDGTCTAVEATIDGCTIYDTKNTCSQCQTGRVLSADGKTCNNDQSLTALLDANCSISYISSTNKCMKCVKGYILDDNNVCTACTSNTIADGCYVCNPYDNTKCTLCAPGFYQTKDAKCLTAATGTNTGGGGTDTPTDPDSGSSFESRIMVLSFMLILSLIL